MTGVNMSWCPFYFYLRRRQQVVQTLLVMLKKAPVAVDKRLLVLGTTSIASHIEDLQLVQGFNVTLNVPQVGGRSRGCSRAMDQGLRPQPSALSSSLEVNILFNLFEPSLSPTTRPDA